MLLVVLVVLLFVSVFAGVWGNRGGRSYGYVGWSPFGVLAAILLFLWLTGNLGNINWGNPNRGPLIHDRR